MKKFYLSVIAFSLLVLTAKAQMTIGANTTPATGAVLDLVSPLSPNQLGLYLPRVNLTGAITNWGLAGTAPATGGMTVYNTNTSFGGTGAGIYYWDGTKWNFLANSGSATADAWLLKGNGGTNPLTNFIGTTDAQPLIFKVNNIVAGYIDPVNGVATFGRGAGNLSLVTATGITAFGSQALKSLTTGANNTALGDGALGSATTGASNTALGYNTLGAITTATGNTALGFKVLNLSTSAGINTGVGSQNLSNNSTGSDNTSVGYNGLLNNSTGSGNTSVGEASLSTNTTGNNNTAIGFNADVSSAGLSNATAVGYNAKVATGNSLVLGGTGVNAVNVGIGTASPNASSVLDLSSATTKGIYPTQVALSATNLAAPVTLPPTSLLVYNTLPAGSAPYNVTPGFYYNAGTPGTPNWMKLFSGNGNANDAWLTLGNGGTSPGTFAAPGTNFIGTTDNFDWAIRTNNIERMRFGSTANGGTLAINGAPISTQMLTVLQPTASSIGITGSNTAAAGTGSGSTIGNGGIGVKGTTTQGTQASVPYNTGAGVWGQNTNSTGTGIIGVGQGAAPNYLTNGGGAAFTGTSNGVFGYATTAAGIAVYGSETGATGTGVYGLASGTTGDNSGVEGQTASSIGEGVYGYNSAAAGTNAGYGVWGETNQKAGAATNAVNTPAGVWGYSQYGAGGQGQVGVVGSYSAAGYGVGVLGLGYGGIFSGSLATPTDFGVLGQVASSLTDPLEVGVAGYYGAFSTTNAVPQGNAGLYGASATSTVYAMYAYNTTSAGAGLKVNGTSNLIYAASLGTANSIAGSLIFNNSNVFTTTIIPNSLATANSTLILPVAPATVNGQVLTSTTAGILSWNSNTSLINAENGINVNITAPASGANPFVELGGNLVRATTISQGNFNMIHSLSGTGDFNIVEGASNNSLYILGNHGAATDGNVGIGVTNPLQELEVGGLTKSVRIDGVATSGTYITAPLANTDKIMFADANGDLRALASPANSVLVTTNSGAPKWVSTAVTNGLFWTLTGNSAISPPAVPGTYGISTFAGTENWIGTTSLQPFAIGTNNIERMRVLSTGNIGIGTAAPTAVLDVNGYNIATGNTLNVSANALTTGTALNVNSTGTISAGGNLATLVANNATTGNLLNLSGTALTTGSAVSITAGTTTGNAINLAANNITAGSGISETANGITSGSALKISSSSTAINGGSLINISSTGAGAGNIVNAIKSAVTGTNLTNIAGSFSASGGTNNMAINVPVGGGQVLINQSGPVSTNLQMSVKGSTYSDNQVSTISLLSLASNNGYVINNTVAADIATAGFEPSIYRPDGYCEVKLVVIYTSGTGGIQFQLHAHNNFSPFDYYPVVCSVCGDTWTSPYVSGSGSGSTYVATSPWKDFNYGTNAFQVSLNEFVSAGGNSAGIINAYLLVRPKNL